MKDAPVVSVIVPAYNASATIGGTLQAIFQQDFPKPFEVIVVDDGSVDGTEYAVCSFPSVKYARQDNAGPASARNHGARLAQGEYLAFTDSDCIPHRDWISLLVSGFDRPQAGAVAGSYGIANPQSPLARCIHKEIVWRHAHLMPDFPNSFGSYNFCVRKKVFEAVGGFNCTYRQASGEDNDLSYKIAGSGLRIFFERRALVDHHHTTAVGKYLKEQFRHGCWRLALYKDHPQMMRGDGYTFWKDIVEMPAALACLVLLVMSPADPKCLGAGGLVSSAFLLFEEIWALIMTGNFFEGISFGFVCWCRAFARLFGFSTGILLFGYKPKGKIF
ncbi:MAG: glycosyltransferase [Candidatus Omnitrophica bacterium]|nr:glycosyltransferase [Candidatus Omnitrophota bacterium]